MSIGDILATARHEAGLSVEDVSRETRIRGGLIHAIEVDNFEPCGGDVYARGHIRSIATVVGVDPRPLIAEYDERHGEGLLLVDSPAPAFDPHVAQQAERRRPNWSAAMGVALLLICVIAGVQLLSHRSSGKPAAQPPPTTSGSPAPTTATNVLPSPAPSNAVAIVPQNGVHVRVRVVGSRSWIQITGATGQVLFQGILTKGQQRDFADARRIRMTIGYAPALDLIVNGHDLGTAGTSSKVVHKDFGPPSSSGNGG
ncbi:MAG: helix-turn-helix domain-containing protein [Actinomycetes bacterium]